MCIHKNRSTNSTRSAACNNTVYKLQGSTCIERNFSLCIYFHKKCTSLTFNCGVMQTLDMFRFHASRKLFRRTKQHATNGTRPKNRTRQKYCTALANHTAVFIVNRFPSDTRHTTAWAIGRQSRGFWKVLPRQWNGLIGNRRRPRRAQFAPHNQKTDQIPQPRIDILNVQIGTAQLQRRHPNSNTTLSRSQLSNESPVVNLVDPHNWRSPVRYWNVNNVNQKLLYKIVI